MQNYETLLENLAPLSKNVKDAANATVRLQKAIQKNAENGNLTDAKGEKGVYEMFPYKVRILGDEEHPAEVYMDRKKVPSYRPEFVAETIRQGQARLNKANFNAASFMEELAAAYEITCLRSGHRIGATETLVKIYKNLALMARARKEYDMQAFAFDLSRLYEAGTEAWTTRNGTKFDFGTSRDGATGIRVLSRTGVESFISTLRIMNED